MQTFYRLFLGFFLLFMHEGCIPKTQKDSRQFLTIAVEMRTSLTRNFNPLLSSGSAREFTVGAIYEPLFLYNRMAGHYVPWLATAFRWEGQDYRQLRMTIRNGVLWSDGTPMGAADVVASFQLIKRFPALDAGAVWSFLSSVEELGPGEVLFTMQRTYTPGLAVLANQVIVPKHIWDKLDDPVAFANPNPVGTGPFTEVSLFKDQVYELAKNPHYWQPGKPMIEGLRFPAFASNDQANLALLQGEVDLAANFVPAIDRIFVKKDPEHHRYWFPLVGPMIFFYLNTQQPPFDRPAVRKAISMSIDRQRIADVAMYRYTKVPHPSGLTDALRSWRMDPTEQQQSWIAFNPEEAKSRLEAEGWLLRSDGYRYNAEGQRLNLEIAVVNGWSDWVRAAQIIASQLESVGVFAKVKAKDFGAWFETMQKGEFQGSIGWSTESVDPYGFYRWVLDQETVKPVGQLSPGNWHRFGNKEATGLLRAWERTIEPAELKLLSDRLQSIFMEEAPALPLFPAPAWGAFNTTYFQGFPDEKNPYATLSPNTRPEILLLLNQVSPKPRNAGGL